MAVRQTAKFAIKAAASTADTAALTYMHRHMTFHS